MPRVALVTDSTAYLPPELAAERHIGVVPVQVVVGGRPRLEGVDVSAAEVAAALRDHKAVSTSRPSPAAFARAYQDAADAGAEAVVSAHLSAELSGTYQTAVLAAAESPIPVTVLDSRTLAMALGFSVLSGADAADAGGSVDDVADAIRRRAAATRLYFYVDTLEYLRRGGRMGSTAAAVGSALRIKPILHVEDGRVQMLEKARTAGRALDRMADLVVESAGSSTVDIDVSDIDARDRARQLAQKLRERVRRATVREGEIGAVVGAHVGPGMVSVVVAPRV